MTGRTAARRVALVLEYDGTPFGGSQVQKNAPTIQGKLEKALHSLTGERVRLAFAGRTDAGVHARGQVAAFTTASTLETAVFVRALNATLPEEIAVRHAQDVAECFDPRRDARSRSYRYTINNSPVRSPLWSAFAWHVAEPLNTEAMQEAAAALVGEHDFAAFSRREGVRTVRSMQRSLVTHKYPLVTIDLEANAFLRQQVRRTAGAMVQVGTGRLSVEGFRNLLQRAESASAGPLAPAGGLCLSWVKYPGLDLTETDTL